MVQYIRNSGYAEICFRLPLHNSPTSEEVAMRKGYIEILEDRCKGCEMCIPACPSSLISFPMKTLNKAGYYVAEYNDPDEKCTACKSCAVNCPDCAIVVYKRVAAAAGGEK
jgi:2-oxoglutarate ferredoxin oxidoreductase subunit delta